MNDIKLIAVDLDGTLLQEDRSITERDARAIRTARERGVKVVLATGRMYSTTVPYARQLDLTDTPLICFNGAYITDLENKSKMAHYLFSTDYARHIHREVARRRMHANFYLEDDIHVASMNELVRRYKDRLEVPITVVEDIEAFFDEHRELTKVTIQSERVEEILDMERWIASRWPDQLYLVRSHPLFLEVSYPGITKGTGVRDVARALAVEPGQVMTIGDNLNDAPMIEYAGLGVAMGNADEGLKLLADHVTAPNTESGVGRAIERFVLEATR